MERTLRKGKHRSLIPILGFHAGASLATYEVEFDKSCQYDLKGNDQWDWNKLRGWSYGHHHRNSVRIGWRWNKVKNVVEFCLYCYHKGQLYIQPLETSVFIGDKVKLSLIVSEKEVLLTIRNEGFHSWASLPLQYERKPGYRLGLYFGGNLPAPHKIKVWIKRVL